MQVDVFPFVDSDPVGSLDGMPSEARFRFEELTSEILNGCEFGGLESFEEQLLGCLSVLVEAADDSAKGVMVRLLWIVWAKAKQDLAEAGC